jgi:hypothetical protein
MFSLFIFYQLCCLQQYWGIYFNKLFDYARWICSITTAAPPFAETATAVACYLFFDVLLFTASLVTAPTTTVISA